MHLIVKSEKPYLSLKMSKFQVIVSSFLTIVDDGVVDSLCIFV